MRTFGNRPVGSLVLATFALGVGSAAVAVTTTVNFAPPVLTVIDPYSFLTSVGSGDFTGDGIPDVVTVIDGGSAEDIAVYPGTASGAFGTGILTDISSTGTQERGLAVGDVNSDGNLDVLFGEYAPDDEVHIAFGDGTGLFTIDPTTISGTPLAPWLLALGDLDNDGDLDLVIRFATGYMEFYLNNGSGTFTGSSATGMDTDPRQLILADVNNDGNLDVVTTDGSDITVSIAYGNGLGGVGSFTNLDLSVLDPDILTTSGVGAADFDGDGLLELAVTVNGNSAAAGLYIINPRVTPLAGIFRPWNATPAMATTGDVTGDGIPDAITAWSGDDRLVIWPGLGDGTVASTPYNEVMGVSPAAGQPGAYMPMLANFGGDGDTDVIVAGESYAIATVMNLASSSSPGRYSSPYQFTYLAPDGSTCIGPNVVEGNSWVTLPSASARCGPADSTVIGWTIPGQDWAFPPGYRVFAIESQNFTAVVSGIEIVYDANVALADTCTPNNVVGANDADRTVSAWVPRADIAQARFATSAACSPPGYQLAGWTDRSSGTTYWPDDPVPSSWADASLTRHRLYAMWSAR